MPSPDQIPYVSQLRRLANIDDVRDIPIVGDIYGAGNMIIDYAESDCHPDWQVYVETLFPAVGDLFLSLVAFGLDDVLRGYLRPAGGRGFGGLGRASRRSRRLTRAQRARGLLRGGIPEIGELLGKNLPGAQTIRGRNIGGGQRWLWRVDALGQRALWHWMVADLTEQFVANWTSGLYESGECECPDAGGVIRGDGGQGVFANADWAGVYCAGVEEEWGDIGSTPSAVFIPSGRTGSLTGSTRQSGGPLFDGALQFRFVNTLNGIEYDLTPNPTPRGETASDEFASHVQVGGPAWIEYQVKSLGGPAVLTDSRLTAWVSGICTNH